MINQNPEENDHPCRVSWSKNDGQAEVDDYFGKIVRAGNIGKPVTLRYGVPPYVVTFQIGKDFVSFELVPPGPEKHQDAQPLVQANILEKILTY